MCIYISVQQKHNTIKQLYSNNKRKMIVKGKKKILPPFLPLWFIARLVAPNSPVKVGKNLRPSHGNPRSQPRPNGIQTHLSLYGCSTRAGEVLRKADSIRTLGVFFPLSYFGQRKKKNLV